MATSGTSRQLTLRSFLNWAPILMLHEVLPDGAGPLPPYAVSVSQLRAILSDFAGRGYESGALDDVFRPGGSSKKRLVLTFDDGTQDFWDNALPVLREFDFRATLFIVAGVMGGRREWMALPGQPELAAVPLMGASQLRALHTEGFVIGSHTLTHRALPVLSRDEAKKELTLSREILGDLVGEQIRWFAYPYVAADAQSRALVREAGYEAACGGTHQKHERFFLNRIDASAFSLPELRLRCNGLAHLTRQVVRQARYRTRDT